jgi:flavin-dependent dehydrogenase
MAIPQIEWRDGFSVEALCWDPRAGRVTGVRGRSRSESPEAPRAAETLTADLVVDATGRSSALAARLNAIGFPAPGRRVVEAGACYTSRLYHAPRELPDWSGTIEYTYAPHLRHGGFVITVEGGRRLVALVGAAGQSAPTDEEGFFAYAKGLRNPLLAEAIAGAEPAGPIYRMMKLDNRWTLWHRMRPWPDRLLCIGDVLCSLNPIYGQGMTVAAIQARLLRDGLERRTGLSGLAARYHRRAARSLWLPWLMATSTDLNWNPGQAPPTARIAHWYFTRILQLATGDRDIYRRFFLVGHMLKPPSTLLHPRVLARVATSRALPIFDGPDISR